MTTARIPRAVAAALIPALVSVAGLAAPAGPPRAVSCGSLRTLALPDTTIVTAESVPAGPFTPPVGAAFPVPAFCRVAGSLHPSPDSDIRFEVWLPSENWNHRLQGIGNGGFAGSIDFGSLRGAIADGSAAAATDTGHAAGTLDAAWALGHPEKIVDFGYRAIHATAQAARAIVNAFYGGAPKKAYFSSCSNGGRQALMEAQRYPADYDGLIAGAPANDWTHLLTSALRELQIQSDPVARIPPAKLAAIEDASLAACDAADGVKDGVIENPASCRFDPSVLRCRGSETDGCLTAPQVESVKKMFDGVRSSSGALVFPGHPIGGITGGGGWSTWVTGPATGGPGIGSQFGIGFFTNMVLGKPPDPRGLVVDREVKAADDRFAAILNATNPDLSAFSKRGGKLILYHGWSDPAISAYSSIDYQERVTAQMGAKNVAAFERLYLVPGLQHCTGGPGTTVFGASSLSADVDREHSLSSAMVAWVEDGRAPDRIIATRYRTGTSPASGVLRQRPLCAYPQVAQWKGSGSTDEAGNFTCSSPKPSTGRSRPDLSGPAKASVSR